MGVMLCAGEELRILRFSGTMLDLLKISDHEPGKLPHTISDLLPHSFREPHAAMLAKTFKKGALPDHLTHPLRNVELLFPDGISRKVNLSLGKLAGPCEDKFGLKDAVFSAVVTLAADCSPLKSPARSPISTGRKQRKNQSYIEKFALHMYGRRISDNLASGIPPPTENHPHAGVMFIK
eukprot:3237669-Rhodomonas_salina.4